VRAVGLRELHGIALGAALAGLVLLVGSDAQAGARLEAARWNAEDPRSAGSTVAADGLTITTTTPLTGRAAGSDLHVAGSLQLDVTGGRDVDLSFLTDAPWVTCEAPGGLTADADGRIAFVCRARARGLDGLAEPLRVYVKVDPTGGLAHRTLYWVLEPAPAP
jgi:hypothetical protein